MTYERKIYGTAADDEAPVLFFGHVTFDPDYNLGFVQPVWLCINTTRYKNSCRELAQLADPAERGMWRGRRVL